jgi:arylsulfatase A-like enzyme
MDACIASIFQALHSLGIEEETLVVIDSDHGETHYDHECWFDHHGLYDCTIRIPLIFVYPGKVPAGRRFSDYVQMKDIMPTILDLLGVKSRIKFDGRSLLPLMRGKPRPQEPEFYITEATWMRKHGWRTPEWKLIQAIEPDFHFKPQIELYNLIVDPEENHNVAKAEPGVVTMLQARMNAHIERRTKQTGRTNPMLTNLNWHGHGVTFESSQQAYDTLHIGSPQAAEKLQAAAKELRTQRGAKEL